LKLLKSCSILLFGVFLLCACSSEPSEVADEQSEKEGKVQYKIVLDEKAKKIEQRTIRATTDSTKKAEFETITKEVMDKYENENLDSIHFYIHSPDGDSFGTLKAHSFIAYTQKGAAQTGLDKADTYKIEIQEVQEEKTAKEDSNEPTEEEWQATYQKIAISEAEKYVELTERDGTRPADRLEAHSGVVQQQADKLTDETKKEKFNQLATLIKENKIDEVKSLISELKQ
jgi:hypothetical protein